MSPLGSWFRPINLMITIQNSKLFFYTQNLLIEKCSYLTTDTKKNLFENWFSLSIIFGKNIAYMKDLCPYVFSDLTFRTLIFDQLSNTFIRNNYFTFYQPNSSINPITSLNYLKIDVYRIKIDKTILDNNVFKYVENLLFKGVLDSIDQEIFLNYTKLSQIYFRLKNLREFFYTTSNKWMDSLNQDNQLEDDQKLDQFVSQVTSYQTESVVVFVGFFEEDNKYYYPNEDICLFKDFPHNRAVYPVLYFYNYTTKINCSCTILWLQRYKYIYKKYYNMTSDKIYTFKDNFFEIYEYNSQKFNFYDNDMFAYQMNPSIDGLQEKSRETLPNYCSYQDENFLACNYTTMWSNCEKKSLDFKKEYSNFYDISVKLYATEFILQIIMMPIFSFIGIISNLMTLFVLRNKNEKENLKQIFFKYAEVGCVFNIIFCLIMMSKLINFCLISNGIFCPDYYSLYSVQIFDIYMIKFFGSIVKFCSSFTEINVSLNRLKSLTNKKKSNKDKN